MHSPSLVLACCLVLFLPASTIAAVTASNLQVQTDAGRSSGVYDVIQNGVPNLAWAASSFSTSFDKNTPGFQLYFGLKLNSGANEAHSLSFSMTSVPQGVFSIIPDSNSLQITASTAMRTVPMNFNFDCIGNGTATGSVIIMLDGSTTLGAIFFNKICLVFPNQQESELCVSMSNEKNPDVVLNGVYVSEWTFISQESSESDTFYFWLSSSVRHNYLPFSIESFLEYDPEVITPVALPSSSVAYPLNTTAITVRYNCNPNGGETSIAMIINISGDFNDVVLRWTKRCEGPVPIPYESHVVGWSISGYFFFTLFVMTILWCVTGCFVNRCYRKKTGLDVIPGIDVYRDCFLQLCNKDTSKAPKYEPVPYGSSSRSLLYRTDPLE